MTIFRMQRSHLLLKRCYQQQFRRQPISRGLVDFNFGHKKRSLPRIEWFYIPAGVGFGLICLIQVKHIWKREHQNQKLDVAEHKEQYEGFRFKQWQIDLLKNLPTRSLSRLYGYMCDAHLPMWLRKPLINAYCRIFDCDLEEALINDPTKYDTFNKFFTRQLKPGMRLVHPTATMVSPADSTVLSFGSVDTHNLELEQIKGFTYPLKTFVGPSHPFYKGICKSFAEKKDAVGSCPSQAESQENFKLFYCTLYLGPGDYHWFHSPTEWTIEHRRHIPGHLFSVNPIVLQSIDGIFNFNERVLLSGHWQHGLFLYGAVGAYNVGSIKLNFKTDKDLQTNSSFWEQKYKDRSYSTGELLCRGDSMGRFELGSSLVLVFTAPKDFQFNIKAGQKLKYGEPIGSVTE